MGKKETAKETKKTEEKKAEVKETAPTKLEVQLQEEVDRLKERADDLLLELTEVRELNDKLEQVSDDLNEEKTRAQLKKEAEPDKHEDCVYLDGKCYKVLLVEEAKELSIAVQRSEVDDDRTVVVVDRHGA